MNEFSKWKELSHSLLIVNKYNSAYFSIADGILCKNVHLQEIYIRIWPSSKICLKSMNILTQLTTMYIIKWCCADYFICCYFCYVSDVCFERQMFHKFVYQIVYTMMLVEFSNIEHKRYTQFSYCFDAIQTQPISVTYWIIPFYEMSHSDRAIFDNELHGIWIFLDFITSENIRPWIQNYQTKTNIDAKEKKNCLLEFPKKYHYFEKLHFS